MFKAKRIQGSPVWNIMQEKTNKVVAEVVVDSVKNKNLFIQGECICRVDSIREAQEKLQLFLEGNKTQALSNKLIIEELKRDLSLVRGEYAYKLIAKDIERLERNTRHLERFSSLLEK